MSGGFSVTAVAGSLLAVLLGFVTQQVGGLGWMVATGAVWLLGLGFSVAGLVGSRGRSAPAWLGIAISMVLPLAVAYLVSHPASGS